MVFYTYEPYSEINVTLHLSPTKCKAVVLSLYDVQHFCPLNKSNSQCSNYFDQITQGTSLSLSLPFLEQFSYSNIVFSVSGPGCLVLQISTKIVHAYKNKRQKEYDINRNFELSSESIMSFGVEFHYQITGALFHDASVQSLYYSPETLDFISIDRTEKFCFRQFNKSKNLFVCRNHLNQSTCENSDKDFYGCEAARHTIQASQSDKTPIVVTSITKSPFTLEKFAMDFRIYKNSESWIDVVIIKTTLSQGNRLCDSDCHILLDIIPLLQNKTVFNVKRFYNEDDNMLFLHLDVNEFDKIKLGVKKFELGIKTALNLFFETLMLVTYSMSFWELNKGKVFSLPEKMDALKIKLEESVGVGNLGKVKVMWLQNNYIKFLTNSNPFWTLSRKCRTKVNMFYHLGYRECLNISFVNTQYHYILYSKEFAFFEFERLKDTSDYTSWREASELCRDIGGYLPYFTSKEELDELLAFLKLSSEIHPIEAVYIGLTLNEVLIKTIYS